MIEGDQWAVSSAPRSERHRGFPRPTRDTQKNPCSVTTANRLVRHRGWTGR